MGTKQRYFLKKSENNIAKREWVWYNKNDEKGREEENVYLRSVRNDRRQCRCPLAIRTGQEKSKEKEEPHSRIRIAWIGLFRRCRRGAFGHEHLSPQDPPLVLLGGESPGTCVADLGAFLPIIILHEIEKRMEQQ